jgi:ferrous iron transport protein B
MTLADLKNGEKGTITKVLGRGAFRKRIIEMGFVRGKEVEVIKNAPLKDPIEYRIMGYNVSLRRNEARLIEVYSQKKQEPLPSSHTVEENSKIPTEPNPHERPRWGRLINMIRNGGGRHYTDEAPDGPHTFRGIERHRRWRGRRFNRLHPGEAPDRDLNKNALQKIRTINIALVGNPNCGKTTLFNYLSGSREKVGNYGGVTVEAKKAQFRVHSYHFNVIDLPGTYSITEYTPEELFVRNYIFDEKPDVVINVIDSSNLERNLYLTTQLIDMDIKVVVALNMFDELEGKGDTFDYETLGRMIGIPFVRTVSTRGDGVDDLIKKAIDVYEDRDKTVRHIHINYGTEIERSITAIQDRIKIEENFPLTDIISSRFLAIKLLEKDKPSEEKIFRHCANRTEIFHETAAEIMRLEQLIKEDSESIISDAKYAFIAGALKETFRPARRPRMTGSEKIDYIVTHSLFGIPLFIFFMWLTFQMTFTLGDYPMAWIDTAMGLLSAFVSHTMPAGPLKSLIVDGILAGIGGVIIFLPNILILFFMISFMEDTGYMARAAFIMDKVMHRIGLHGKSFIPMLMGFGCNVPAIMATRTIESRNDRLLTMIIIPFMSCSARLPVYVLFISAFFSENKGSMLFLIYAIGILTAALSGILLKKSLFKSSDIPFVMELPPYRMPKLRTITRHMWEKGAEYLKKIGGIILVASIIIWALGNYPLDPKLSRDYEKEIFQTGERYDVMITAAQKKAVNNNRTFTAQNLLREKGERINLLKYDRESERLSLSYIGRIGHLVEPVMRPLGFDWKMSVSIMTGLAAKEVVVGTMGVLYHAGGSDSKETSTLINNLRNADNHREGRDREAALTPLSAFTFVLFILLYFPCVAVLATIRRESGTWRWALFSALYSTTVAWLISFMVYQAGKYLIGIL